MAESGPEDEFRVTDRRRRADVVEALPPPSSEEGPPRVEEPPRRPSPPEPADSGGTRPDERGERSLEGLFVMLASSAVVALGDTAAPMTGQVGKDPAAAAEAIDLLVLLREKTEGHRTPRETQLLDELIYDLQLRYVAAMKPRL